MRFYRRFKVFQKINRNIVSSVDVDSLIQEIKNGYIRLKTAGDLFKEEKLSGNDFAKVLMECDNIARKEAACVLNIEPIRRSLEYAEKQNNPQ